MISFPSLASQLRNIADTLSKEPPPQSDSARTLHFHGIFEESAELLSEELRHSIRLEVVASLKKLLATLPAGFPRFVENPVEKWLIPPIAAIVLRYANTVEVKPLSRRQGSVQYMWTPHGVLQVKAHDYSSFTLENKITILDETVHVYVDDYSSAEYLKNLLSSILVGVTSTSMSYICGHTYVHFIRVESEWFLLCVGDKERPRGELACLLHSSAPVHLRLQLSECVLPQGTQSHIVLPGWKTVTFQASTLMQQTIEGADRICTASFVDDMYMFAHVDSLYSSAVDLPHVFISGDLLGAFQFDCNRMLLVISRDSAVHFYECNVPSRPTEEIPVSSTDDHGSVVEYCSDYSIESDFSAEASVNPTISSTKTLRAVRTLSIEWPQGRPRKVYWNPLTQTFRVNGAYRGKLYCMNIYYSPLSGKH